MMIILRPNPKPEEVMRLEEYIKSLNLQVQHIKGADTAMIGLAGDTSVVDLDNIEAYECVDRVIRVQEP
jgi:3-deoxy-7-phosphoheptulonate synthase